MPIMAVVVPKLKSTRLGWQLEGERRRWPGWALPQTELAPTPSAALRPPSAWLISRRSIAACWDWTPPGLAHAAFVLTLRFLDQFHPCRCAGKYLARQTCLLRGVVPMLAAPMSEGSGADLCRPPLSARSMGSRQPAPWLQFGLREA